jgi:hypothetical protein
VGALGKMHDIREVALGWVLKGMSALSEHKDRGQLLLCLSGTL